jgi:hypothetical protein
MWLLKFLPEWIFYVTLFGSAGALLLGKFMPLAYKTIIRAASAALLAFSIYMIGGIANEEVWQERVKELEAKVAAAQVESVKETVKIVQKVVTKQQIVRQRGEDIIKYVDKEIVKYDNTCVIPKEFITAHNKAAEQPK